MATRPKTLAAAAVPVAVGTGVAIAHGQFQWLPALVALLGAFLIQIGTNLANDYFDFKKGADNEDRLGPTRVVSSGLISPTAVRNAMILAFALAAAVGSYLIWLGGWPILVIGVLSILSGIAYTGGPFPLGYNGLGDLFVFIFFGVVAVMGTYYVQALEWSLESLVASVPVGLLSVAILIVNNYRDIDTDRAAGKMTLAVRLGRSLTRVQYQACLGIAYAVPVGQFFVGGQSVWVLLPLASAPMAVWLRHRFVSTTDGSELNSVLEDTAKLLAVFGLLYAVGLAL
jgi:1,4-dihydroxy-2-naphthoate octaprenyltransferase